MVKTVLNRAVWEAWHRQQPEDKRQSYEEWAGEKIRRVVPLGVRAALQVVVNFHNVRPDVSVELTCPQAEHE